MANAPTPLLRHIVRGGGPPDLAAYTRGGGYEAARGAVGRRTSREIVDLVKRSELRGRGGAGFPTGQKWGFVPVGADAPRPKYLVINADEMEPGAFKDRALLEGDPHQLLEGIILSAYAIEAEVAYVFLRGEYQLARRRLGRAIAEAYDAGVLGPNVLGSGYRLDVHLHMSAGRYICGEETALLNALEGKRANPRAKPPFPPVAGLWGKPTVINNVETVCNVPHIVLHGPAWFKALSRTSDSGTKLYGISGKVKRPGLWELPMGTPARHIVEECAGGIRDGHTLRGFLPGGASTDFLLAEHLDVPLDFLQLPSVGSRLGTGTLIVLDDKTCPVGMVHNLIQFFAQESCGLCTPCWSGLAWAERLLADLERGRGSPFHLIQLEQIVRFCAPGNTFCALAPGAVEPLGSALRLFREDFDAHVQKKRCPWRS